MSGFRHAVATLGLVFGLALTMAGMAAAGTRDAAVASGPSDWSPAHHAAHEHLLAYGRSLTIPFLSAAADSDTSLDDYVEGMADTTGDFFGISAAPLDTDWD